MRRHKLFIGLLVIVAAVRFTMLLKSQTHVHSDEAIIGLMGKYILKGSYFPFYMYGQAYNAGAAWEAYLAALSFAFFGVNVVALKSCIVVLSLVALGLFYWMCLLLYNQRTALLAGVVFALTPSLLNWHFQVRGYSWYFLSIPLLTILFLSIQAAPSRRRRFLFFGIVSGLSIWSLELGIAFNATLWILFLLSREVSWKNAVIALGGFIIGYGPALAFNLTHHFANWNALLEKTGGGGMAPLFHPGVLWQIFWTELPKFFGPDTVLWYYPEKPASGFVFYLVALLAAGHAAWPFIRSPSKIAAAIRGGFANAGQERDLLLLFFILACFVPYVTPTFRVPGYFLAGCFFFAALTGRVIEGCFGSSKVLVHYGGAIIFTGVLIAGTAVIIGATRHNQIETLTLCGDAENNFIMRIAGADLERGEGQNYCMTRIPGADLEGVENYLRQHGVTGVWTSLSFVYPLLFECNETFPVSNAIFGDPYRVYPAAIPWREPRGDGAFVIENVSPLRILIETAVAKAPGMTPLIKEYGTLTVIEGRAQ